MIGEANRDYDTLPPDQASFGPKLGFLGEFQASMEAQRRTNSLLGLEVAFRDEEQEQVRRARKAGVELKSLNDQEDGFFGAENATAGGRQYRSAARYFVDGGDDPGLAAKLAQRDEAIDRANKQNPDLGLRTYRDLFGSVQEKAKRAEEVYDKSPFSSIGGRLGSFAGSAVGGMSFDTDPVALLTLPLGGGGATVAGRIGIQAATQGGVQAVSEALGVQDNRRLLGLESGFGQALGNVAGAALGGAAFQGLGEGVGCGFKRWFKKGVTDPIKGPDVPPEPARVPAQRMETTADVSVPEQFGPNSAYRSPVTYDEFNARFNVEDQALGSTRAARAKSAIDIDYVAGRLDDWHGPQPSDLRSSVMAEPYPTRSEISPPRPGEPVDAVARRIDPDTFNIFDKLQRQADQIREAIGRADDTTLNANAAALRELEATIAERTAAAEKARSIKVKERLQDEVATLATQRDVLAGTVSPTSDALRSKLQDIDYQMRDHAPLVSRAYAQAKGEVGALADSDATKFLQELSQRNPEFRELPQLTKTMEATRPAPPVAPLTNADRVPLVAASPDVAATVKGDLADKVAAVARRDREATDALSERFKQVYDQALKDVETEAGIPARASDVDPNIVEISGRQFHLDNDTIEVPSLDGDGSRTVTVRDFLRELQEEDKAMSAVTTCTV